MTNPTETITNHLDTISGVQRLLEENGNLFFSATFKKKDGTFRTMQARMHSTRGLAENPSAPSLQAIETRKRNHPNLISVRDVHAARQRPDRNAWRSINLDTLISLNTRGKRWVFLETLDLLAEYAMQGEK
jgi:hypothetical protein